MALLLVLASAATLFVALRSIDFPIFELPQHNDSAHYTLTSRQLFAGEDPYVSEFGDKYQEAGLINSPVILKATNPPALAFIYIPFALAPLPWGYIAWSLLQAFALIVTLRSLNRSLQLGLSPPQLLILSISALVMCPTISHLQYGQTQLLMLALVTIGAERAINSHFRSKSAWALWGIATSFKLFTWPLIGVALLFGGWPAALLFLASTLAMQLPAALLAGPQLLFSFLQHALPYITSVLSGYNSNNGLIGALTYSLQIVSADPAATLPGAVCVLITLTPLIAIVLLKILWRPKLDAAIFLNATALALIVACLFSPSSWNHYLVLLIFALLCLLSLSHKKINRAINPASLLISYFLLGLAQGRVHGLGIEWELASIWWGPLTLSYVAMLLILGTRALIRRNYK